MLLIKITKNQKRFRAYPTHQAVQTTGSTALHEDRQLLLFYYPAACGGVVYSKIPERNFNPNAICNSYKKNTHHGYPNPEMLFHVVLDLKSGIVDAFIYYAGMRW
jgi:hypothetical protein